jgi:hypothetical protein
MIGSITETWTVIGDDGTQTWSSEPNGETAAAADNAARASNGTVLRALYRLVAVEQEASYAPLPPVLAQRNTVTEALAEAERALAGDSYDDERDALVGAVEILRGLLS